jgi:hypothetical protein
MSADNLLLSRNPLPVMRLDKKQVKLGSSMHATSKA